MKAARLAYDIAYAVKTLIFRQRLPYMFGLQITDSCNLNCFYCEGKNAGKVHLSYAAARTALVKAHQRGNRSLYLTGGEPMLWRDGNRTLTDLVREAYSIGFFNVLIVTNGTQPFSVPGVSYLVTIDGPRNVHDLIRSNTFDLIIGNARNQHDSKAFVTITINKANRAYIRDYIIEMASLDIFRGILFNTLTHWPQIIEKYGLTDEDRISVLDEIWNLKKQGYPVILSKAAYQAFKNNDWKRPIPQIELSVGTKLYTCCRDIENREICKNCGYLGCIEISQVLALKPSALIEVLKLT